MKSITKYLLAIVALFGIQAPLAGSSVTVRNMTGESITFTVEYGSGPNAVQFIDANRGAKIEQNRCWINFLVWPTSKFNPGPKTGLPAKLVVPFGQTDKCGTTFWKLTKTGPSAYQATKVSSVKDLS